MISKAKWVLVFGILKYFEVYLKGSFSDSEILLKCVSLFIYDCLSHFDSYLLFILILNLDDSWRVDAESMISVLLLIVRIVRGFTNPREHQEAALGCILYGFSGGDYVVAF